MRFHLSSCRHRCCCAAGNLRRCGYVRYNFLRAGANLGRVFFVLSRCCLRSCCGAAVYSVFGGTLRLVGEGRDFEVRVDVTGSAHVVAVILWAVSLVYVSADVRCTRRAFYCLACFVPCVFCYLGHCAVYVKKWSRCRCAVRCLVQCCREVRLCC